MERWTHMIAVVCVLIFVLPSSPVHVSYVYSDSMEPTIMEGDGYVLIPAGTVEAGDILTFYSDVRGEYATHRVVELTDEGFVTKGDNNPSTDQSAGYAPVTPDDVLGKVATIGGRPLVIPQLGVVITTVQTHWQIGVGGLIVLFSLSGVSNRASRSRDVVRFRTLLLPLLVMAVVGSSAALVLGAPTSVATFSATNAADPTDSFIPVGESSVRTIDLEFSEQPGYTHQFVETEGMELIADQFAEQKSRYRVRVPAQSEPGTHRAEIRLYRYPASLPYGVVAPLQAIHPVVAAFATMSAMFGPLSTIVWLLVDGKALLQTRSRRRPLGRVFK